ncbi:MAG: hypothetical protein ABIJ21_00670 [Nanoarchaeota archaeon]
MTVIDQLVSAIRISETWEDLYTSLMHKDLIPHSGLDRKRFVDAVEVVWLNAHGFEETPCAPLPGRVVIQDGVTYVIHGVVHDSPWVSIRQEFKDVVSRSLERYAVMCEDGFTEWVPQAQSFHEAQSLGLRPSLKDFLRIAKKERKPKNELHRLVCELSDVHDLLEVRKELFKAYLPEPLGMRKASYLLGVPPEQTSFPRRYVFEANEAKRFAEERDLSELHILVGCAHELPLEYLLSQDLNCSDSLR